MHNDPIYLLEPVYHFLDRMIHDHGDILYILLVYASMPLIAWILSGGLRRKSRHHPRIATGIAIVIQSSTRQPPPPPGIILHEFDSSRNDDDGWFE